jgi:hypothetical protein
MLTDGIDLQQYPVMPKNFFNVKDPHEVYVESMACLIIKRQSV